MKVSPTQERSCSCRGRPKYFTKQREVDRTKEKGGGRGFRERINGYNSTLTPNCDFILSETNTYTGILVTPHDAHVQ